jgi:hypothetical protein
MPEYLKDGLEVFYVPEGVSTEIQMIVNFTVYADGSVTVPLDLTSEQSGALIKYLTWGNEHMREKRGNSIRMMPEEKGDLLDAFIQTMKSPERLFLERICALVLAECNPWLGENHTATVLSCEEMFENWQQDFIKAGDIPATGATIHEVRVAVEYQGIYGTLGPKCVVDYLVVHYQEDNRLELLRCECQFIPNRDYVRSLRDED